MAERDQQQQRMGWGNFAALGLRKRLHTAVARLAASTNKGTVARQRHSKGEREVESLVPQYASKCQYGESQVSR